MILLYNNNSTPSFGNRDYGPKNPLDESFCPCQNCTYAKFDHGFWICNNEESENYGMDSIEWECDDIHEKYPPDYDYDDRY